MGSVGMFTNVVVAGAGVTVDVKTGDGTSVQIKDFATAPQISHTVFLGTLFIYNLQAGGACGAGASITVPSPLYFAGAAVGARLTVDHMGGSLAASGSAMISVQSLVSLYPVSIAASSDGSILIGSGNIDSASLSASSGGNIAGGLAVGSAYMSASSYGTIAGLTLVDATISASDGANLQLNITGHGSLTCTSGSVASIGGGGTMSKPYVGDCQIESGASGTQPAYASWCKWIPTGAQSDVPDCSGLPAAPSTPSGAEWCKWIPPAARSDVPDCSQGLPRQSAPNWCQWVPAASQQFVADCSPQTAQQPSHWCQWVPQAAKQYVADCAPFSSLTVTPSAGSPSWCQWVPGDAQHNVPDCSGLPTSNSQGSASWCKWVPASAKQYVADCSSGRRLLI